MVLKMIKSYINLFLTLLMPMLLLFIIISTIYYASIHFAFSQAMKLGTVAGTFIGAGFSLFVAFVIVTIRIIRLYSTKVKATTSAFQPNNDTLQLDPTLYEKKTLTVQKENTIQYHNPSNTIQEKMILLMDQNVTYQTILTLIRETNIGDITTYDKHQGIIHIKNEDEEIHIRISALTKHSSEIQISSTLNTLNIKNLLSQLKEKEHSFVQY